MIRNLTSRARYICSEDTLNNELQNLRNIFRDNGYPERFIERNMKPQTSKPAIQLAEKKKLYIKLPFKGDTASEVAVRSLRNAVNRTFGAAELQCSFTSSKLIHIQQKDKLPLLTTSMVIYSFRCACGATYVGRTVRQLSQRINEHHPKWIQTGRQGIATSAISSHLVDSGHKVNVKEAFRIVYRVPTNRSKVICIGIMAKAEAITTRLLNPKLGAQ